MTSAPVPRHNTGVTLRFTALRVTAALFAAVFASAPIVATLHADDHAHVYCAEHQAIEESGSKKVAASATDAWTTTSEAADHESCELFALTIRSATPHRSSVAFDVAARAEAPAAIEAASAHCVVQTLLQAPKASPPQA